MNISLKSGLDKTLYKLLSNLYQPFLSAQHLKDRFQFTIFSDEFSYPIGIVSVNKGKNTFLQIALIPDLRASGVGRIVLGELIRVTKLRRIGWSCEKNNYPSLKLLCSLGGGVTENSVRQKKKKTFEGFFYADKPISKKLRDVATGQLENARKEYAHWVQLEYRTRSNELIELRKYLLKYVPIIDVHSHQITHEATEAKLLPEKLRDLLSYPDVVPAIAYRLTMGVPDCGVNIAKINDEIVSFCKRGRGALPVAILEDDTDVSSMIKQGVCLFKEHVYGQKLLKTNSGRFAKISSARMERYGEISRAGIPLLMHVGPNVVERVSSVLKKVPALKLILAHLSSPMDHKKPFDLTLSDIEQLRDMKNVFFDVSAITDIRVIEKTFAIIPTDRLLWGSDFPYDNPQNSIDRLLASTVLPFNSLVQLFSGNARKLIGVCSDVTTKC